MLCSVQEGDIWGYKITISSQFQDYRMCDSCEKTADIFFCVSVRIESKLSIVWSHFF